MPVITNPRTSQTLELDVDVDSLRPQDSGAHEAASVELDVIDIELAFDLLPEDEIIVSTVEDDAVPLFGGFVRNLKTTILAIGRVFHLIAYDYSTLLDRINVVQDDRPAGESDHDRLVYFITTYAAGLLDPDDVGIATLNASMPAQKFRLLSLRQAIEQILATALDTADYRITTSRKLDTWDSGPGLDTAPFNVVVGEPGDGEMAPEDLTIVGDTTNLFNAYWVRGATPAGSGWFTDPVSIAQWGRREKYIDAPDSDLSWKAFNVGMAALADTSQPLYRGTFTATSPFDGWRSNQRFLLTSPQHDLVAAPFDTVRVTPRFLSGEADQAYDIEFGSPKASFAAKHGKEARRADGVGSGSAGFSPTDGGGLGTTNDMGEPCCPDPLVGTYLAGCHAPSTFGAWYPITSWDDPDRHLLPTTAIGSSLRIGTSPDTITPIGGPLFAGGAGLSIPQPPTPPLLGHWAFDADGYVILSFRLDVPVFAGSASVAALLSVSALNSDITTSDIVTFVLDNSGSLSVPPVPGDNLPTGDTYNVLIRFSTSGSEAKVWPVSQSEPVDWTAFGTGAVFPSIAGFQFGLTTTAAATWPQVISIDNILFCVGASTYPPAYEGRAYGPVLVGIGDGSTTAYTLPVGTGYIAGTVGAFVAGLLQPIAETDPTTNAITTPLPVPTGKSLYGTWTPAGPGTP